MYLSVIIPVYNEEKNIGKTLEGVNVFLQLKKYAYEILVVDDGSTDKTVGIIRSLMGKMPAIRVVSHIKNMGKGAAVRTGMLQACGEYRLFMDADGSTPIEEIDLLLPYFAQSFDVVLGSRKVPGSIITVPTSIVRRVLSKIFSLIVELLFSLKVNDSQNGFKVFSKKSAEIIFSQQKINRWAFDVEVLFIARKMNLKIKEVPIRWKSSDSSHMTFGGMRGMLVDLLKIKLFK